MAAPLCRDAAEEFPAMCQHVAGGYTVGEEGRGGVRPCRFDHKGFDHKGFDHKGFDHKGFDRKGFDHIGLDHKGFDHKGFDYKGFDHKGFDYKGFDHKGLVHIGAPGHAPARGGRMRHFRWV